MMVTVTGYKTALDNKYNFFFKNAYLSEILLQIWFCNWYLIDLNWRQLIRPMGWDREGKLVNRCFLSLPLILKTCGLAMSVQFSLIINEW